MRNKKIAEQVRARDGMCVCCGAVSGLDAHHIDTFGAHGEDDPLRMVTLCRVHHTLWHNGDCVVRAQVEDYLKRLVPPGQGIDTLLVDIHF